MTQLQERLVFHSMHLLFMAVARLYMYRWRKSDIDDKLIAQFHETSRLFKDLANDH